MSYCSILYCTDEQLKSLSEKSKELEAAQDRSAAIQVQEVLYIAI